MSVNDLRIGLIGPLPPPSGGMANQTRQLARLLEQEGIAVEVVQTNAPYRPHWIGKLRGVRAAFRLVPYLVTLWHAAGRVQLFHVMANSGWAWDLFAAPAVWIARARHVPVIVNYRGGDAANFFARSLYRIRPTLRIAHRVVVPSGFLQQVFARFGFTADIVPNVVDLGRFAPRQAPEVRASDGPHLIVTRNLEEIYDIGTAVRAFAIVAKAWPKAHLTVAGTGPERDRLLGLARTLGVESRVSFVGRLDNDHIDELYRRADVMLNPSVIDNMPISILEALASGVPVVSTAVGGVPFIVEHGRTALLVPARDAEAMARAVLEILSDRALAARLVNQGRESVQQYSWQNVRAHWLQIYGEIALSSPEGAAPEVN